MRYRINAWLIAVALGLSACGLNRPPVHVVSDRPPAADLADKEEPAAPVTDSQDEYDDWNDAVLIWGRGLRDQLARVRAWFDAAEAKPKD